MIGNRPNQDINQQSLQPFPPGKNRFDGSERILSSNFNNPQEFFNDNKAKSVRFEPDLDKKYPLPQGFENSQPDRSQVNKSDQYGIRQRENQHPPQHSSFSKTGFQQQPPAVQKVIEPKKFTQEEKTIVKKVLANVVNFMEEDKMKSNDLLGHFDPRHTGLIQSKDLERALYDDLYMEQDINSNLFVDYYSDHMGRVPLNPLLSDLERFRKARIDKKNYDLTIVREHISNNKLALVSTEKLAGYNPPFQKDQNSNARMKEKIEKVKDFFYDHYGWANKTLFEKLDLNKDNVVTKKEFFDKTIDSGMQGMSREELAEVFRHVDSNNNGVISLKEFK